MISRASAVIRWLDWLMRNLLGRLSSPSKCNVYVKWNYWTVFLFFVASECVLIRSSYRFPAGKQSQKMNFVLICANKMQQMYLISWDSILNIWQTFHVILVHDSLSLSVPLLGIILFLWCFVFAAFDYLKVIIGVDDGSFKMGQRRRKVWIC